MSLVNMLGYVLLVKNTQISLNLIFMNHIKKCLPKIRENIIRLIQVINFPDISNLTYSQAKHY